MVEKLRTAWKKFHTKGTVVWHVFKNNRKSQKIAGATAVLVCGLVIVLNIILPPSNFPKATLVLLPKDVSAPILAEALYKEGIISHPKVFLLLARIFGLDTSLSGGAYIFPRSLTVLGVLLRVGNEEHGITQTKVTLTEGMTVADMANALSESLPGFNKNSFLNEASTSEGYLFPETYFILPGTSEKDLVDRFRKQFDKSYSEINPTGDAVKRSPRDIVILASILEREARGSVDMKIVSGILYNRLRIGMPLQVDAVFGYIHEKNGYTPTATDLSSDSPYNTYKNKGLPPTPIANPGLIALTAAAVPTKSSYFYYLTGKDGAMHYAKTFEEHKRNRALYLD